MKLAESKLDASLLHESWLFDQKLMENMIVNIKS